MFLNSKDLTGSDDKKSFVVLKTNRLVTAIERLTLAETRLIQLAIIGARESGGIKADQPLLVSAKSYSETFNTTIQNAYKILLDAESRLFEQTFYYLDEGEKVKTRWVTEVKYKNGSPSLMIVLSKAVIKEIINIDGYEKFFTTYRLAQTSDFTSIYSLRLFELLMVWEKAGKTPIYELQAFRNQLGIESHEYPRMTNFKDRVLDIAIKEINENTDIKVSYDQHKKGRSIVGFSFIIKSKRPSFKRQKISIAEAIELSQSVVPGSYVAETEKNAIKRVMEYKDEQGRSVYLVDSNKEAWAKFRANRVEQSREREKKSQEYKWITIGNTRVDDDFIDKHKQKGESMNNAKERLIRELQAQLELGLNSDEIPEHVRFLNKILTKYEAEKLAKIGEDWVSLKERLRNEGYTLDF